MQNSRVAQLILENGDRFTGKAFGHIHDVVGEVVFTTNMTGYQETLTDPSFCGQIVVMTYPLIGNYGINFEDMESDKPALSAFVEWFWAVSSAMHCAHIFSAFRQPRRHLILPRRYVKFHRPP